MTGKRHVSWSQLSSFRGCPRKWWFSHVEGAQPAFIPAALLFGSAFHDAVQAHYRGRLEDNPLTLDELQGVFDASWDDQVVEAGVPVKCGARDTEGSLKDRGHAMLEAFVNSELADLAPGTPGSEQAQLLAIEEAVTGALHPDMPTFVARIDVMWRDDDGLHLMDLKTARSPWSETQARTSSQQLRLYARLASAITGDEPVRLHFGVVTKAKTPAVQRLDLPLEETTADPDDDPVVRVMLPVWHAMAAGVDFANPNPMNCSTCPYAHLCPAADLVERTLDHHGLAITQQAHALNRDGDRYFGLMQLAPAPGSGDNAIDDDDGDEASEGSAVFRAENGGDDLPAGNSGGGGGGDYAFVVGLRNSHDQSFPASLVIGSAVFVCDNLAFSGEVVLARRHTRFIVRDLPEMVDRAGGRLGELRVNQDRRIEG